MYKKRHIPVMVKDCINTLVMASLFIVLPTFIDRDIRPLGPEEGPYAGPSTGPSKGLLQGLQGEGRGSSRRRPRASTGPSMGPSTRSLKRRPGVFSELNK
ncbi:hypothetical protein Tco_0181229, partial [Tanacetum coccineum]